jgi:alkylated DNA repair dioxygenase AlkB
MVRRPLFESDVPHGLHLRRDFLTSEDEHFLVEQIAGLEFSNYEMRGVVARRRVAFFGRSYDAGAIASPPLPAFLVPLRDRLASWAGIEGGAFEMALVNEYRPGAPIGWHRDAPQYGIVAGVSLLSSCRMKFRPYVRPHAGSGKIVTRRIATHEILLEPRSAYVMTGEARHAYEHHIPAVSALRYSITFRTMRAKGSRRR